MAAFACRTSQPWGAPTATDGHHIVSVCHEGYASGLDPAKKETRWVSYELTAEHDMGCYRRAGLRFKVDITVPVGFQARPADYAHSGYDLGHMAPNEDFAWSKDQQRETFLMTNVEPQLPGLNRQGWERLEEDVRAWALQRGDLQIYVGPIYGDTSTTIGEDALVVPTAFFKVAVDKLTYEAVGFIMPQQSVPKGDAELWKTSISDIEHQAHVRLPLPANVSESANAWPADLTRWRKLHRERCRADK
jgi:endonuclease G